MAYSAFDPPKSILARIWGAIDSTRRFFFNAIFLVIAVAIIVALLSPSGVKVQEKTALVLNLDGRIVEQRSGGAREKLMGSLGGDDDGGQVQLRDIVTVLDAAAKDPKIERILLQLDQFPGAGLSSLREVGAAITRFRASGKQVFAWAGNYDQASYYLAAHADEVYMHPMGLLMMQGYGRYRNYYKDALDRVGVSANVIRSGKYKNFGEPYFTTAPSKETMESDKYLYDGLWATFTGDVEKVRKFEAGAVNKSINEVVANLKATGGDAAKMALNSKLVTALKTRDELRTMLIEKGAKDEEKKTFRQVSMSAYLSTLKSKSSGDAIGVVVAEGEISDGIEPPGKIGGRSTADLIRKAREDEKIKAVVLRVNSPGGSAYGSELIRRELELTRKAGKPVVVSMGNVAASGGYWISMAADEVIADAATITGSIGVFGMLPTGEKTMEKLSVYTGGYHTTWLGSAMYDPRRALDPRMAELVKLSIDHIYTDFTTKAAAARKTTPDKIDEIAQGRVWTGAQAKDRGLIDRTGSFADAVKAATTRAKLDDGARLSYIEADRSKFETFLERFATKAAADFAAGMVKQFDTTLGTSMLPRSVAAEAQRDLTWLAEIAERGKTGLPFAAVAHCLCGKD
ncbi:MAG: signal peptide peptidase SppA [Rhodocyclaceae bacterium]|nr:signal peptide peptidase SppA [Rhodocyclaceae bacterium]